MPCFRMTERSWLSELAKLMLDSVHTRIRILHLHTSTYNSSIPEWALTYSSARDSPEEDDEGEEPRKEEPPMAVYSKTSSVARLDLQFSSLGLQSPVRLFTFLATASRAVWILARSARDSRGRSLPWTGRPWKKLLALPFTFHLLIQRVSLVCG